MKRLLYALASLVSFAATTSAQTTYVTAAGAGNQSGSSWANACSGTSLRSLLRVPPASATAAIWVAAGTYRPHASARDSTFNIAPGVRVYGGFAGTETQLSQRNWVTNVTVLSGDIGVQNDSSDNSYNVVSLKNADGAVLDGFTVTRGNANHPSSYYQQMGGGILNLSQGNSLLSSKPYIARCRVLRNHADGEGGGLMNNSVGGTAAPTLVDCVFENNDAGRQGGAICSKVDYGSPGNSDLLASGCTFRNNKADGPYSPGGGAIGIIGRNSTRATIRRCLFEDNQVPNGTGGAVDLSNIEEVLVDSCQFNRNSASSGSAIQRINSGVMTLSNSSFSDQLASGTTAVVWLNSNSAITRNNIVKCRFLNNQRGTFGTVITSVATALPGMINGTDTLVVSNSFFYNNGTGYDLFTRASDNGSHTAFVTNCTVYHDSATSAAATGVENWTTTSNPSFSSTQSSVFVRNCILWHKLPYWNATAQFEVVNSVFGGLPASSASSTVSNSILTGAGTPWPAGYGTNGGNNSGLYPRFMDTAAMDFRPGCGSFALDKGNNAFLYPAALSTDLANGPRIFNNTVDIGAFETDPAVLRPRAVPVATVSGYTLTYASQSPADSLRWSFGDGTAAVTQASGTYVYKQPGTYKVCLTAKNACGSKDSCITVVVRNGNGIAGATTGSFACYPNPAADRLYLSGAEGALTVRIYSMLGQQVQGPSLLPAPPHPLELNRLLPGTYLLEATASDGSVRRLRFSKQ